MSDDMLSNAVILKKTALIRKKKNNNRKTADKRAHFHTGSSVPVHRMSVITIVSVEFILKASSEIIGHSLGRTIGAVRCGAGRGGRLKALECKKD